MNSLLINLYIMGLNTRDRLTLVREDPERGATAVEYGLMVGLIAVVIIVAVTALGGQLKTLFESVTTKLTTIAP
jgi:pilus assembly protein Flp/PilA